MAYTRITKDWEGQEGFIVCGGTSVTREVCEALRGRNVIPINSMYTWVPFAPCMFFADLKWWKREIKKWPHRLKAFKGIIYTITAAAEGHDNLRVLRRTKPPQVIVPRNDTVGMARTSLSAALNIMVHKGVSRIYILGADNAYGAGAGDKRKAHCHSEHPWKRTPTTWKVKTAELQFTVEPLKRLGIEVFNCSPISTLPFWPRLDIWTVLNSQPNNS